MDETPEQFLAELIMSAVNEAPQMSVEETRDLVAGIIRDNLHLFTFNKK